MTKTCHQQSAIRVLQFRQSRHLTGTGGKRPLALGLSSGMRKMIFVKMLFRVTFLHNLFGAAEAGAYGRLQRSTTEAHAHRCTCKYTHCPVVCTSRYHFSSSIPKDGCSRWTIWQSEEHIHSAERPDSGFVLHPAALPVARAFLTSGIGQSNIALTKFLKDKGISQAILPTTTQRRTW